MINVLNVLRSQVTRVFWLVFGSDNYFVGTFVCIKCEPGDFIEEGEGHLVVKGLWVSRSCIRSFIGVQGSQNVVDRFQLRKEEGGGPDGEARLEGMVDAMCVCVCERERESAREREIERERAECVCV